MLIGPFFLSPLLSPPFLPPHNDDNDDGDACFGSKREKNRRVMRNGRSLFSLWMQLYLRGVSFLKVRVYFDLNIRKIKLRLFVF